MAYCGPHGIPHSHFLAWDQDDQDKAIAWIIEDRMRCPNCGSQPDEWVDEDGLAIEPPPYTVRVTRCMGCVALADERHQLPEGEVGYNTSFSSGEPA